MMNELLNASKIGKMKIWDSFLIVAFDCFQNNLMLSRVVPVVVQKIVSLPHEETIAHHHRCRRASRRHSPRPNRLSEGPVGRETVFHAGEHHPAKRPMGRATAMVRRGLPTGAAEGPLGTTAALYRRTDGATEGQLGRTLTLLRWTNHPTKEPLGYAALLP